MASRARSPGRLLSVPPTVDDGDVTDAGTTAVLSIGTLGRNYWEIEEQKRIYATQKTQISKHKHNINMILIIMMMMMFDDYLT